MQRKTLITLALAGALLGVCGLSALAAYSTVGALRATNVRLRWFEDAATSARLTETLRLDVGPGVMLAIDGCGGDIDVRAGGDGVVEGEQVVTGWGADAVAALAAAKAVAVRVEHDASSVRITCDVPDEVVLVGTRRGHDAASFTLRVPAAAGLELRTGAGSVRAHGTAGPAVLRSGFGDVHASGMRGAVEAQSGAGAVTAEDVDAGAGDVALASDFGAVAATAVRGRALRLSSRNGALTATGLTATGPVEAETAFGDIDIADARAAELTATTQNGAVDLRGGEVAGTVAIDDAFGDVTVADLAAAALHVAAGRGKVTLDRPRGAITVDGGFGDIEITGALGVRLDVAASNGAIAFDGSLDPAAVHRVETDFGSVTLALPADSRLDVRLRSDFGAVTSDLPITVTGAVDGEARTGTVNGGGAHLEVTTRNGDIALRVLPAGAGAPPAGSATPSPAAATTVPPAAATTVPSVGGPGRAAPPPPTPPGIPPALALPTLPATARPGGRR